MSVLKITILLTKYKIMKNFIAKNWYKATIALSFLILSCGIFIYSIDKTFAKDMRKTAPTDLQCVGGAWMNGANPCVIWSDGTWSVGRGR